MRHTYRLALLFLLVGEVAAAVADRRGRGDTLEAFDASDVLEAHGVEVRA